MLIIENRDLAAIFGSDSFLISSSNGDVEA